MKSVPLLNPRRDLVSSAGKNEIKFVFDFEIAAICLHFLLLFTFPFSDVVLMKSLNVNLSHVNLSQ